MPKRSRKLRVGVVGLGGIGQYSAKYYASFPDVDLIAGCDISPQNLTTFESSFPGVHLYADYEKMIAEERLEAVSVCTPNGMHCGPALIALKAGCHVLVEKPMAVNAKEVKAMLAAARRYRRRCVVGFHHRFDGRVQALRKAFDAGFFGKVMYVRSQALHRRNIPNWGVFGRKDLQGGGPMIDIGVHCLEMAHYAIGMPKPVSAMGNMWTYLGNRPCEAACARPDWDYKTYTVEDLAVGHIRMANGAVIHIEASFAAHIEKDIWSFQLFGEKGGASLDPFGIYRDDAGLMLNCTPAHVPTPDMFEVKLRDFVDVCLHGKPSQAPGQHGLVVQRMLDAIYASAEKGGVEVRV
jgi:predicted dehydrogenase